MPVANKRKEIVRLIKRFEKEADEFHEITLRKFSVSSVGASKDRKFEDVNHTIMLWQFQGWLNGDDSAKNLARNIAGSDLQWGVRGALFSSFAVVEGRETPLFVRMASRAGALFDKKDSLEIGTRLARDFADGISPENRPGKPIINANNDPLAIWLNFIFHHISLSNPGREQAQHFSIDPFSLSLSALESLLDAPHIPDPRASGRDIDSHNFKVALSFPGQLRRTVAQVAAELKGLMNRDEVFYDFDFQPHLARPNLDLFLIDLYSNRSELVVVFLGEDYNQKEWCGVEWRAIRELIKTKNDAKVMLIRMDETEVPGSLSVDGYVDGTKYSPEEIAAMIFERTR